MCRLDTVADPGAREFFVGEGDWPFRGIVVRRAGAVHAYANICPHKGHPLNLADDDFLVTVAGTGTCSSPVSRGNCSSARPRLWLRPCFLGRGLRTLPCRVAEGMVLVRSPESQL